MDGLALELQAAIAAHLWDRDGLADGTCDAVWAAAVDYEADLARLALVSRAWAAVAREQFGRLLAIDGHARRFAAALKRLRSGGGGRSKRCTVVTARSHGIGLMAHLGELLAACAVVEYVGVEPYEMAAGCPSLGGVPVVHLRTLGLHTLVTLAAAHTIRSDVYRGFDNHSEDYDADEIIHAACQLRLPRLRQLSFGQLERGHAETHFDYGAIPLHNLLGMESVTFAHITLWDIVSAFEGYQQTESLRHIAIGLYALGSDDGVDADVGGADEVYDPARTAADALPTSIQHMAISAVSRDGNDDDDPTLQFLALAVAVAERCERRVTDGQPRCLNTVHLRPLAALDGVRSDRLDAIADRFRALGVDCTLEAAI